MNFPQHSTAVPMTDDEIDRLAALLDHYGDAETGMNLEALDGYMSALVVGPSRVDIDDYLPGVWGQTPAFESAAAKKEALALIDRLRGHIVWRVQQPLPADEAPEDPRLLPMIGLPEGTDDAAADDPTMGLPADFPLAAAWAMGFGEAASLRADAWDVWCERHQQVADDFDRIADLTLVDAEQLKELDVDDAVVPDLATRLSTMFELPAMLQDMYLQRQDDERPATVRRAAVPGRNDGCPCGSGRKYKKCCGSAETTH
jgi:uncharacterized protein